MGVTLLALSSVLGSAEGPESWRVNPQPKASGAVGSWGMGKPLVKAVSNQGGESDSKPRGRAGKESPRKASWEQKCGAFKLNLELGPRSLGYWFTLPPRISFIIHFKYNYLRTSMDPWRQSAVSPLSFFFFFWPHWRVSGPKALIFAGGLLLPYPLTTPTSLSGENNGHQWSLPDQLPVSCSWRTSPGWNEDRES